MSKLLLNQHVRLKSGEQVVLPLSQNGDEFIALRPDGRQVALLRDGDTWKEWYDLDLDVQLKNLLAEKNLAPSLAELCQILVEMVRVASPFHALLEYIRRREALLQESEPDSVSHHHFETQMRYLHTLLPAFALLEEYSCIHLQGHPDFYARVKGTWNTQAGWREGTIIHPISMRSIRLRKHATLPEYYEVLPLLFCDEAEIQ